MLLLPLMRGQPLYDILALTADVGHEFSPPREPSMFRPRLTMTSSFLLLPREAADASDRDIHGATLTKRRCLPLYE